MTVVLGGILGLVVGAVHGLLGGGGSTLTVPILVYVLGLPEKTAIAGGLAVILVASAAGALRHHSSGNVNVRLALSYGLIAMLSAYVAARLSAFVSGAVQLAVLGSAMMGAGALMIRGGGKASEERSDGDHAVSVIAVVGSALLIGVMTGLAGVSGGFLVVPVLVLLLKRSMREAVGTALLVAVMTTASGFVGYLGQVEIPWDLIAVFAGAVVIGSLIGAHFSQSVPQRTLKRAFSFFLVGMGFWILYQNRGIFLS